MQHVNIREAFTTMQNFQHRTSHKQMQTFASDRLRTYAVGVHRGLNLDYQQQPSPYMFPSDNKRKNSLIFAVVLSLALLSTGRLRIKV